MMTSLRAREWVKGCSHHRNTIVCSSTITGIPCSARRPSPWLRLSSIGILRRTTGSAPYTAQLGMKKKQRTQHSFNLYWPRNSALFEKILTATISLWFFVKIPTHPSKRGWFKGVCLRFTHKGDFWGNLAPIFEEFLERFQFACINYRRFPLRFSVVW